MTSALDIRRLATLRAVAHGGSFAAAAEALWLTPSAVSQQMANLERDARAVLFERTRQGMRLTESGWALAARAETILSELVHAERELADLACGHRGRLRVGSFPAATAAFVAEALARFHDRHPAIGLDLTDGESEGHVARVRAGELDLAVVTRFGGAPPPAGLRHSTLFADPLLVVVPRGHRLAALPVASLTDLAGEPILGCPAGSSWTAALVRACCEQGVETHLEPCFRTDDPGALKALVASGGGIVLLPRLKAEPLHPALVARPVERAPEIHVEAVVGGTVDSPSSAAMLDALREATVHLAASGLRAA